MAGSGRFLRLERPAPGFRRSVLSQIGLFERVFDFLAGLLELGRDLIKFFDPCPGLPQDSWHSPYPESARRWCPSVSDVALRRLGRPSTRTDELIDQRPAPFRALSKPLCRLTSFGPAADLALLDHAGGRGEGVTIVAGHA
jgi:hypothetical protein